VDEPTSASATPVEVLVAGRHDHRDEDDAVVAFAEPFGPRARVTFYLSLDDPLLREMAGRVKELLERLGMTEDEPVAHAMVSLAIAKAQRRG
jgi:preprotein translocase subunit SecA